MLHRTMGKEGMQRSVTKKQNHEVYKATILLLKMLNCMFSHFFPETFIKLIEKKF